MVKHQSKRVPDNVEVTFQDETTKFNLSSTFAPGQEQKIAPPKLAFVNLTGSSGPTQDASKRKQVRAHVMREFQREKQEREQKVFERWKEQNQNMRVSSVQQISDPHAVEMDQWTDVEGGEMQVEESYESLDWTATFPYQPHGGPGFFSQHPREWTPRFILPREDGAMTLENTSYQAKNLNTGFNLLPIGIPNQLFEGPDLFASEDEERPKEMVSGQVECRLISNSIKGMTPDSISFTNVDPFNSMPGLRNWRAQAIMYHYNQVLVATLISVVDPESKWFNYAITDPALFHGTMLHSAAHNAMLSGSTDLADPIPIKWEATRLINQRLDDPVLSISDVTMGAVVCLVLFENQAGNVELSNIHMNGLRRMINLRGGIQNLGLAGVLKRKILWADLCNATLTHSKPQYNLLPDFNTHQSHLVNSPSNITRTPSPLPIAFSTCDCNKALAEIIASLRLLSNTVSNERRPKPLISDEIYLVERRLVVLLSSSSTNNHSPSCQSRNYAGFLACLIYIYVFLRDFPLRSPLFGNLAERLVSSLFDGMEDDKIEDWWNEDGFPMLSWVLVIGALVTEERCERERFVAKLRGVCTVLGVRTFEDLMERLKMIAWLDIESAVRSGPLLRVLWNEVQLVGDVVIDGMVDVMGGF